MRKGKSTAGREGMVGVGFSLVWGGRLDMGYIAGFPVWGFGVCLFEVDEELELDRLH